MTIRQTHLPERLARLMTMTACIALSHGSVLAQSSAKNDMVFESQQDAPARAPRPAFQVSADPNAKPLPPAVYKHDEPHSTSTSASAPYSSEKPRPPSPEEIKKREAEDREMETKQASRDRLLQRLLGFGKSVGFLVVLGIGVYAAIDVSRQLRNAKEAARKQEEGEEWDP
jgi:hypothetical protein